MYFYMISYLKLMLRERETPSQSTNLLDESFLVLFLPTAPKALSAVIKIYAYRWDARSERSEVRKVGRTLEVYCALTVQARGRVDSLISIANCVTRADSDIVAVCTDVHCERIKLPRR